jgi:hypothetical protein
VSDEERYPKDVVLQQAIKIICIYVLDQNEAIEFKVYITNYGIAK